MGGWDVFDDVLEMVVINKILTPWGRGNHGKAQLVAEPPATIPRQQKVGGHSIRKEVASIQAG